MRKLCNEKPREWHRYLVPTLFALREIPSDRTGFPPFHLLYGRQIPSVEERSDNECVNPTPFQTDHQCLVDDRPTCDELSLTYDGKVESQTEAVRLAPTLDSQYQGDIHCLDPVISDTPGCS